MTLVRALVRREDPGRVGRDRARRSFVRLFGSCLLLAFASCGQPAPPLPEEEQAGDAISTAVVAAPQVVTIHEPSPPTSVTSSATSIAPLADPGPQSGREQANLLENPDFEQGGIFGWFTWSVTGDVSQAANHTPGGHWSASPTLNDDGGPFPEGALLQEIYTLQPDDVLCARAWIKAQGLSGPASTPVQAFIRIEYWAGKSMLRWQLSDKVTATSDWQQVRIYDRVPARTTLVKLLLLLKNEGGKGSAGQVFFDDAALAVLKP